MSYFKNWNDRPVNSVESDLIKGIQKATGAVEDGMFGTNTLARLYIALNPSYSPFAVNMFNAYVMYGRNIKALHTLNKKSCSSFIDSLSGTFQYKNVTSSMFCVDGIWKRESSTHDWLGNPETVIYITKDGKVSSSRVTYANQIKDYKDIIFAVGGCGLHDYNPTIEGFSEKYADVINTNKHTAIGYDGENWIAVYVDKMNGKQIRDLMMYKLNCKYAVLLDGGHIASINSDGVKKFTSQIQNNILQLY